MGRSSRAYAGSEETEGLLHHAPEDSLFTPVEARKPQDRAWSIAFMLLFTANLVAGVLTFLNRNPDFATEINPSYLSDPANCPADRPSHARSLLGFRALDEGSGDVVDLDAFLRQALLWLLVSVGGALAVGLCFFLLVSYNPMTLLVLAIGVQIALPLMAGVGALMQGSLGAAVPLLTLVGLLLLTVYLWRSQLRLVLHLMAVSGHGLRENLGLVGAAIGIQLGLAALTVPLYLAMLAALTNGHVTYNPERVNHDAEPGRCVDAEGNDVLCCSWQPDAHVGPIITVTLFTLLWTSFIANQVKTFTVAGTITQWYFAPVFADPKTTGGRVGRSLRAALGPSFGSLCLGGLVLTVLSMMRSALEELRKQASKNMLLYCLHVMVQFLLDALELITKFATIRLAITGEAFLVAGREVTGMLRRNLMDAFGVWWLPPLILQVSAFVLSGAWATGTFFVSSHAFSNLHSGDAYAVILALLSFLICFLVLAFCISLLLNIIDTVFICYAMDRERRTCSRVEVHRVYSQLPSVGPVIENPDNTYAYAAPAYPPGTYPAPTHPAYAHQLAPSAYPPIPPQGGYAAPSAPYPGSGRV